MAEPGQPLRSGTYARPAALATVKPAAPVVWSMGKDHTGMGGAEGEGVPDGVCVGVPDSEAGRVGVAEGHAPASTARPVPTHSAGQVHATAAGVLGLVMFPPGQKEPAGQGRQRPDAASL